MIRLKSPEARERLRKDLTPILSGVKSFAEVLILEAEHLVAKMVPTRLFDKYARGRVRTALIPYIQDVENWVTSLSKE